MIKNGFMKMTCFSR